MQIKINGKDHELDVEPEMPLLWALRDELGFKGTKFGCGIAACGACTVLVDGEPQRSCSLSVGDVEGDVTTIEGIGTPDTLSHVQAAWVEHQVPQCGYCQSGQILAATALLKDTPDPSDEDIDAAMTNICRCGSYPDIKAAIKTAAKKQAGGQ